ncbi:MAG: hypothetical protein M0021_00735 [Clostridia bacterium]|nr:hypothetical protein [Clostridia bacterium]
MVKVRVGEDLAHSDIRVKVRLDYKGSGKPGRFLFGGKTTEKVAEEIRDHQAAFLRNVPLQGVQIEDLDLSMDVYTVADEVENREIAYAPIGLVVRADSLEDLLQFVAREEFRKIEILEPAEIVMNKFDVERLLFGMNRELRKYRDYLEKKLNAR